MRNDSGPTDETSSATGPNDATAAQRMSEYFATRGPLPESCVGPDGLIKREVEREAHLRAEAFEEWRRNLQGTSDPSDDMDWGEAERDLDSFRPHRPLFGLLD